MLNGCKLSILGDSISTYKDLSNDCSANITTEMNPYFYKPPFPPEKTYWMRVLSSFNMSLCVNNSWSGGNLSGNDDPSSGLNRSHFLDDNDGNKPDLIIVFMGTNDLGRGVDPNVFKDSYHKTLSNIKSDYPLAKVCCVNIPDRDIYLKSRCEIFNNAIKDVVATMGDNFFIADLYNSRLNNDFYYNNTVDGLHPDEDGMKIIADIIIESINTKIKI